MSFRTCFGITPMKVPEYVQGDIKTSHEYLNTFWNASNDVPMSFCVKNY